jgi:signal peptidase I
VDSHPDRDDPATDPVAGTDVSTTDVSTTDAGDGAARETRVQRTTRKRKQGSFLKELPVLIGIALVLALVIKQFLIQAFYIPSESMENTLQVRDRVLVNKVVYRFRDVHRGEIVVFKGPESWSPEVEVPPPANAIESVRRGISRAVGLGQPGEKDFIKRVIGVPGDVVQCCDPDGRVVVNGQPLDEPYVFEDNRESFGPVTVPEGRLWVMGDHRGRSSDSRAHISDEDQGTIPVDSVIGRAFVVIWPIDNVKGLRVPRELESRSDALPTRAADLATTPPVLGLVGAVPLTLLQRSIRLRLRRRSG